jgi:exosortase/archaeosortase family protein
VAVLWPTPVEEFVIQKLTRLVTFAVTEVVTLIGIPAVAHGNVLEVSTGMVGVDEACSGVRSIQATFMIALFFGELYRMSVSRRILLVLSGFSLAILLNVGRTAFLVITAARNGIPSLSKWHDPAGTAVLLVCFLGLWLAALAFRKTVSGNTNDSHVPPGASASESAIKIEHSTFVPASLLIWAIALSLVSVLGSELWFRVHERRNSKGKEWTVQMPESKSHFTALPITDEVRGKLQFDNAKSAAWQSEDGSRWQMYYFRWTPANSFERPDARATLKDPSPGNMSAGKWS